MQTLIESSPLSRTESVMLPSGERVSLLAGRAIVWVSVTPRNVILLPSDWPRFPAVVDTGFNGTFLISERELHKRAGVGLDDLILISPTRVGWRSIRGQVVPPYQATVWIHRNHPQQRDPASADQAFAVYPGGGILVTPTERPLARMPLLGTQLLESCGLRLSLEPLPLGTIPVRFEMRFSLHSLLD
jgi:hypothetical protein